MFSEISNTYIDKIYNTLNFPSSAYLDYTRNSIAKSFNAEEITKIESQTAKEILDNRLANITHIENILQNVTFSPEHTGYQNISSILRRRSKLYKGITEILNSNVSNVVKQSMVESLVIKTEELNFSDKLQSGDITVIEKVLSKAYQTLLRQRSSGGGN